jgi:CRP/FNR family transcriptional regulator
MALINKPDNCKNCDICNDKTPLLKSLAPEEISIINDKRYVIEFKPGENIIKQGTTSNHYIVLTSGLAKLYIEGLNNKVLVLELIKPWKLYGGPGIYIDNRYYYSISAIEKTTACFIDSNNLKSIVKKNPDFAENFITDISMTTAKTFERLVSLTQKQMHGRIADLLLYLSTDVYNSLNFNLQISRQDISDMSGMNKDTAIRILKEYEKDEIISIKGQHVNILKPDFLQHISQHG